MATLTIQDETTSGEKSAAFQLDGLAERTTVRELIAARIGQEVDAYNRAKPQEFRGLVQPTEAERTLNGFRMPRRRVVDAEEQTARALESFEKFQLLVLVDEKQAESLDDEFDVTPETRVTFLQLVPLVGG